MPIFHKVRRSQIRYSRVIALTVFWVMLLFSLVMSALSVRYISKIQYRRDMAFINYNMPLLLQSANKAPEEVKEFIHFNINCMLLQVKMVKENMEMFSLAILFFYLNSLIMLFVLYRKNKRMLYLMSLVIIIVMYFTFTFNQQAIQKMPQKVLGNLYLDEKMLDILE